MLILIHVETGGHESNFSEKLISVDFAIHWKNMKMLDEKLADSFTASTLHFRRLRCSLFPARNCSTVVPSTGRFKAGRNKHSDRANKITSYRGNIKWVKDLKNLEASMKRHEPYHPINNIQ